MGRINENQTKPIAEIRHIQGSRSTYQQISNRVKIDLKSKNQWKWKFYQSKIKTYYLQIYTATWN